YGGGVCPGWRCPIWNAGQPARSGRFGDVEQWEDELGETIGFLQMRVARKDECIDAERLVLGDERSDRRWVADQCRAGAATDQPDAGPQVRADLEPIAPAAMQRCHALLTDRI